MWYRDLSSVDFSASQSWPNNLWPKNPGPRAIAVTLNLNGLEVRQTKLTNQIQTKIHKNCLLNEKTNYIDTHNRNGEGRLG